MTELDEPLLATPGPTPLPPEVQVALGQSMMHHRSQAFMSVMQDLRERLLWLFQTKREVMVLAASGTGAMEAAITNLCSPRDTIITVEAGKFGERWGHLGEAFGLRVVRDNYAYGSACKPERVLALLKKNPKAKLVCVQACETSTGIMHPIRELADVLRDFPDTALVVDAITGLGVFDLKMDDWGLDVVIGASHKALMCPPGVALIALSEKAMAMQKTAKLPRYYFDLGVEASAHAKNLTAWSPAINLIYGLNAALKLMQDEGLENIFKRHAIMSEGTRSAIAALNLVLFSDAPAAPGLTVVNTPKGIDCDQLLNRLREEHNIVLAGGQADLKGQIFRIGHMGYFFPDNVLAVIKALETVLIDLGFKKFEEGVGVNVAMEMMD